MEIAASAIRHALDPGARKDLESGETDRHPSQLDAVDGHSGSFPVAYWGYGLTGLLLRLEEDDRESSPFVRVEPIASHEAGGRTNGWKDGVREH
jgi:hypothetical protein